MRNLSMVVEYEGTHFFGWQYQPAKRTVQGELQAALKKVIGENIKLVGAGRTDQGVHALGQVANFHTDSQLPLLSLKKGTNALVGDDLYVREIAVVPQDFHSRYSAKSKLYDYHLTLEPSPFRLRYSWYLKQMPDVTVMQRAIPLLCGKRDFKNFSVHNGTDNTVCNVHDISVIHDDTQIIIKIEGDRFLRKMVRGIVGFMVDLGRGRFATSDIPRFFDERTSGVNFAPPQGLFLTTVRY
ncbi:MAG: tRNA pseudouridine(38-40) synthase TruA [candidate division WOR-3 bacterium]|nr:MAG: tRNA pseudouridine(38-40) synthase TruA [candidate division WOR-3 bacterium]